MIRNTVPTRSNTNTAPGMSINENGILINQGKICLLSSLFLANTNNKIYSIVPNKVADIKYVVPVITVYFVIER